MLSFSSVGGVTVDAETTDEEDASAEGAEEEMETEDEAIEPVEGHVREVYVIEDDDELPPAPPAAAGWLCRAAKAEVCRRGRSAARRSS